MFKNEISLPVKRKRKRGESKGPSTPAIVNLVRRTCSNFIEFRQGKTFLGSNELRSGYATIGHRSVGVLILYEGEGRNTNRSPTPDPTRLNGYPKIQHLFRLAKKFSHPIVVFAGSQSSLPDKRMTDPDEAFRFANHIRYQWHLEVPIILVVLNRRVSGNIFGAWLADKVLAFEKTCFSTAILAQGEYHLAQLGTRYLLHQGIIDGMISESVCNGHGSSVVMPEPRQLRIALEATLQELSCVSSGELLLLRKEKIERVSALMSDAMDVISGGNGLLS